MPPSLPPPSPAAAPPRTFRAPDGAALRWRRGPTGGAGALVLVLGGRGEPLEKYAEVEAELAARGCAPWSLEWRGQGGSAREPGLEGLGHVDSFELYLADLRAFIADVLAPAARDRPVALLAHSMGAHVALRYLAAGPHPAIARAVLVAPMLRLRTGAPPWVLPLLARCEVALGRGRRPARRERAPSGLDGNPWTRDLARLARNLAFLREHPALAATRPTWGWLDAALRSNAALLAPGVLEAVRTPTLAVLPGGDRIVDNTVARRELPRLPDVRVVEVPNAEHELLMERDEARALFWAAFDAFLAR